MVKTNNRSDNNVHKREDTKQNSIITAHLNNDTTLSFMAVPIALKSVAGRHGEMMKS